MIDRLQYLYDLCFSDSRAFSDFLFKKKFRLKNCFYKTVGGEIVCALFVVDKRILVGDTELTCPYICGVCTHPDHRRKGYAERLMEQAHSALQSAGHYMCALHPFRHSYYEKMGYFTYTRVRELTVRASERQSIYSYRSAEKGDAALMLRLYNQFMAAYSGYVQRDMRIMRYTLSELTIDGTVDIISLEGKDIGYAAKDNDGFISEFCCFDLGALMDNPNYNMCTVNLPADAPIGELTDFTMIKLLNRPGFLHAAGIDDISRFKDIDDCLLIRLVTGSYEDFAQQPPAKFKQLFVRRNNYVFDKY